jgi:hypothetical protein
MPPDQHRSTLCDDVACRGTTAGTTSSGAPTTRTWPSSPPRAITSRSGCASPTPHRRRARSDERDRAQVLRERQRQINWHYLPKSNEILWFSERDDWGNLYLYDLTTGQLKEPDHARPRQRHPGALRRRTHAHHLLCRRRQGSGSRPLLPAFLQRPLRRHRPEAAHARKRRPQHQDLARRPLLRRFLLHPTSPSHRRPRQLPARS